MALLFVLSIASMIYLRNLVVIVSLALSVTLFLVLSIAGIINSLSLAIAVVRCLMSINLRLNIIVDIRINWSTFMMSSLMSGNLIL